MALYNNKNQEKLFHLHAPAKSTVSDCLPVKIFDKYDCEKSYVLAQPTEEFNCIGWGIGVKDFIDPTEQINKHYLQKIEYDRLTNRADSSLSIPLYEYSKNTEACINAVQLFFEEYKEKSVLPKKDYYVAVDKISYPPLDDTISFYFKEGKDNFVGREINSKGFQHAARYMKDLNSWVSDLWGSKFGGYKIMTHGEHELDGEFYGYILCYLVPRDFCKIKNDIFKSLQMCEFEDEYDVIPEVNIPANIVDEQQGTINTEEMLIKADL
jgi:hypothetical protein